MNSKYTLFIKPENNEIMELYSERRNFASDSGLDLYTTEQYVFTPYETKFINFKIKCQMKDNMNDTDVPYYLYARSSISKTPLILHNHVGIIDSSYRGDIIGALRYIPPYLCESNYVLEKGTRILQICSRDLSPFKITFTDGLSETERGEGGFGST
ncbi:putative deoxyuridinetriphosphatase [Bodo saltans virus]|jgi:dUTP pyrophosphatase|uniref:dUTP diphosphatase n=1 Tax=Bodo saltans virus TaxID=2024608 RepID=A0A2H4UTQ4_9VIRU|nr:putative deoxyuridinetriphosphatase [Bodo saltans virus]ATZ80268.1 putative deoxyuridinetriphosphatase [Bodo saltans virus]